MRKTTPYRKNQIIINTTHSVAQLKAPTLKQKSIPFDYLLICSPYCGIVKQKTFTVEDEHMLNIGMPRIDVLFRDNSYLKKMLPNYSNQKIILSMETFKQSNTWSDSDNIDAYAINVVKTREMLLELDAFLKSHNYTLTRVFLEQTQQSVQNFKD